LYHLTGDQNAKVRYENNYSGYRIATSVGGAATGEGGDYVGVDDPHNIEEIYSDVIREGVLEWWDKVMSTRLNDPKRSVRIIVMQRAHENDLAGHVQNQGGWEVLKLPMEYEIDKRKTSIGWSDPRTKEGELLWPERFGREELTRLKKVLGPYGTAGQLQQRPAPEEGGIFKKAWFKLWPIEDTMPTLEYIVQTYDTAFTEDTRNDPSAGETWGLFKHPKSQRYAIILLDAWCEHLEYQDLRKRVKEDWSSYYGTQRDHRRPDIVLVEEKGSGITLLQDLRLIKIAAYGYNPHKADKLVRAHAAVPFVFNGLVWLLESAIDRDHPVSWARAFLHEMLIYDKGVRDNYVDAFTQMILMLRNKQMLSAEVGGFEDEDEEDDEPTAIAPPERRVNPYAA
jgi:phage terminase large subunit-like protein